MNRFRIAVYGAVAAMVSGVAGCSPIAIGEPSPPSRFYLLEALEAPADAASLASGGPTLGVGPVRVAEYLERPLIATRTGEHGLDLAEFDRWAEPLDDGVARVLASNLGALLGSERVRRHPWRDGRLDVEVIVDVRRFDGPREGPVELVAHWRMRRAGDVVERTTRLREPVEGGRYEDVVAAMSRALRELSREIARATATTSAPTPTPLDE